MDLLERDDDLKKLRQLLQLAAEGHGSLVMLGGEAGVGKTAFVRRFMRDAEGRARILAGACDALSTPRPLGPLADIAADIGGEIERLIESAAKRDQVFGACLREFSGAWRPTVAVFEDVHWADEATLDLLRFLGRRISQTRALLIATYRDDEVGPTHPLRKVMGDLATAEGVQRLSLAPLSVDAVRQLAAGSELDPIALHHQTGGNPFFVTEVLAAGGGISETVRDAVLNRVSRLSPSAQGALDLAAIAGSPIEASFLQRLVDGQIDAIEECLSSGVLRAGGQAILFRHELSREAIIGAISPPRRIALHAKVLAKLEAESSDHQSLARLAHHAEESGNREAVLTYAPAAGERAAALGAHREAAAQYARALRFADTVPPDERARLLEARAAECYLCDQMPEGIAARQEAIVIWRNLADRRREGKNLALLPGMLIASGRNTEAEEASRAAIELLERLPASSELASAYASQSFVRMLNRDNAESIDWGQRAKVLADQFGDIDSLVLTENVVGSAMILSGDENGREHLERSISLARENDLDFQAGRAYANLGSSYGEQYQFALADHYLDEGIAFCRERDFDYSLWYMTSWQALTYLYQGNWDKSTDSATLVLRQENASVISRIMALIALGRVRTRRGDPEASNALDEALRLSIPTGTLQRLAPVRAARAEAAWLAGDLIRTVDEASAAFELAQHHRHQWHLGELSFWLWRAGKINHAPPEAAEPFALQIDGDWQAAASAWDRLGCPYEAARARADSRVEQALRDALAEFDRLGARPMSAFVTRRLRELGAKHIPRGPRRATKANPAGLTTRENEILAFICEGLSNAEIAERLYLSPKTVEHHVSAIFAKLGVSSRVDAMRIAIELGIASQSPPQKYAPLASDR
jgi:DNA-binding CsgD family transcriptional regulator/tetratricopeptide (TPR) repeat protein